jgi:hypothetical protein
LSRINAFNNFLPGEITMKVSLIGLVTACVLGGAAFAAADLPPLMPPHFTADLPPLMPPHVLADLPPLMPPHFA